MRIIQGDCLEILPTLPSDSIHCVVTSPPYFGLRSYGIGTENGELGLEQTPEEYVAKMVDVFREIKRVLRNDGTVWLNLGDSYAGAGAGGGGNRKGNEHGQHDAMVGSGIRGKVPGGLKPKDLIGIPWRVAFALQADGWWLRQDIIWNKNNPLPESITDRCTKSHEYIFLLTKKARYWYDNEAVKELQKGKPHAPGNKTITQPKEKGARDPAYEPNRVWASSGYRNKRSVWTIATQNFKGAHFATFPEKLIEPCILAGCPEKCCPKCGMGWVRVIKKDTVEQHGVTQKQQLYRDQGLASSKSTIGRTKPWRPDEGMTQTLGFKPNCECEQPPTAGIVLDPFSGAATTGLVAKNHNRAYIGIELNPEYVKMSIARLS